MTERQRHIAVGFTALAALAGLVLLLMLFGYVPNWIERGYEVSIEMVSANGLSPGSRIKMSGMDIGQVTGVTLQSTAQGPRVTVVANIRKEVAVPQGVSVNVQSPMLGGTPWLEFAVSQIKPSDPGYSAAIKPLPTDGSVRLKGQAVSTLGQLTSRLEQVAENVDRLSQEWVTVGQNVNQLLETRTPQQVDAGQATGNLSTVLARTDRRLKELETAIAGLNGWLSDPQLQGDIRQTAANLNRASGQADRLLASANVRLDELTRRYVAVADELSAILKSTRQLVDQARTGQGTFGKLLSDPALYDHVNDSAVRLEQALTELKLMIEKWRKEGLPVQFH